jgi:HK97 family phage major capsid protein
MEVAELATRFDAVHEATKALLENQGKSITELKNQLGEIEQKSAGRPGRRAGTQIENSFGGQIVESDQFKSFLEGGARGMTRLELKTVVTLGSGSTLAGPMIAPDVRTDPVILPRQRMTIRSLLSQGTTTGNSIWYPRMTARQLNAAPVAESAAKPQSDLTFEQVETRVRTIAHWIQAARQAMDDAPALQATIDSELRYGLSFVEETQLLYGDGTGENLLGIMPQASAYAAPFTFGSGETAIDRILMAIIQSEQALLPATGVVLNTVDWGKIRLLKDAQGKYLLGEPADMASPNIWGLPVIVTPAMTAGNYLVGAFAVGAQIYDRMSTEVLISTEHNVNFTHNEITIRAEERLALAVRRPTAFVNGTLP